MLNPTVFSLSVLPDGYQVHVTVGGLVALNGHTGTHIGIQIKGFPQQQVHRRVASSYWRLQRTCRFLSNSELFTISPADTKHRKKLFTLYKKQQRKMYDHIVSNNL